MISLIFNNEQRLRQCTGKNNVFILKLSKFKQFSILSAGSCPFSSGCREGADCQSGAAEVHSEKGGCQKCHIIGAVSQLILKNGLKKRLKEQRIETHSTKRKKKNQNFLADRYLSNIRTSQLPDKPHRVRE